MINHKNFCRSLAKNGGTITLPSNDQPSIGAFSIGKEGSVSGAPWERFGSELSKEASFVRGGEGMGGAPMQHSSQ